VACSQPVTEGILAAVRDFFGHEVVIPDTIPLSQPEKKLRSTLEPAISAGLVTALQVMIALRTVRNRRLFRTESPTFHRYLHDHFGLQPTQISETLSAISTMENLLLDIFPTLPDSGPDLTQYEAYCDRANFGRPRSTQVAPYRRMGRPPGHCPKLPSKANSLQAHA
jgi:hypothetical protein